MARSISKRNPVKVSTANPLGKTPHADKTLGVDTTIQLFEIDYNNNTEEREDA